MNLDLMVTLSVTNKSIKPQKTQQVTLGSVKYALKRSSPERVKRVVTAYLTRVGYPAFAELVYADEAKTQASAK